MNTQKRERGQETEHESGFALVMVMGVGMVMLLLVATAGMFSLSGMVKARTDQDWNGAMSAAYAGVEEYESRLANNNAYVQYGNSAAAFSAGSTVSLPTGALINPAFGVGAAGTWGSVAGSDSTAFYRYEVDNSKYSLSGTLRIRATGRVGNVTRSVVANLKQQGFIDFLYFSDYEIQDPDQSGASVTTCVKYAWAGRPTSGCGEIAFGSGDTINGSVHSNDTIRICDATFNGPVSTGNNPASGLFYTAKDSNNNTCTGQVFTAGTPTYSPVIGMPSTNSQMKKETRSDLPVDVPRPGCLYTGPTKIVFNSAATMTIRSPWTKKTNVAGDPATSGTTPAACGIVGTGANGLGSAAGATIPVLDANLLYVQNVATVASDPNYWPTSGAGSLPSSYTSSTCAAGNGIGYPITNEYVSSVTTSYGCRSGDVFVNGTLDGAMTIANENFLYVTGDIKYLDPQSDTLGLVGQNAVFVYNPVSRSCSGSCTYSALFGNDRRIDSAILSVAHTFQVQNYDKGGTQGTLTVNGAISQKFRGIVRSGSNGYIKNYAYDQRYRYIAPPKFLSPVSSTYGVSLLVEVKSAFKPDGTVNP